MSRAQRAGAALLALLVVGGALVVGLIISAARGQDRIAAEKSIELVRVALEIRARNTALSVKDYAWWTEAVRNLVDTPSATWAYGHIGPTSYDSIGMKLVTVIDAAGHQTFTFIAGEPATFDVMGSQAIGLQTLIAAARSASPLEPVPATGLIKVGDQLYSVALAALTVAKGDPLLPNEKPRSLLLFGRPLDAPAIDEIASEYRIDGLTLVAPGGAVGERTSLPLRTADGDLVGALAWTPERPGNALIRRMLVPVGATIAGLALLSLIILWQIREVDRARRENQHNLEIIEGKNSELITARDEAEYANRAKSQFLAVMSHELRTPLNAIIGFSEIMYAEPYGALGDKRYKQYVQDIHNSGGHLLSIINDILDLSKIEAGQAELNEEEVHLPTLIAAVHRIMQERAAKADLTFECDSGEELPSVRADRRALKQILLNLLANAVKFTPKGGKVGLRMAIDDEGGLRMTVYDTGIGIEPRDIPRALSAFGQVDASWSRRYEGAGLGLPISRALVRLHGGTLELNSQPGMGTAVTVRLPPERVGPLPRPKPPAPQPDSSPAPAHAIEGGRAPQRRRGTA
ncbi:MAG TPA: ATP-binding protein [Candidatus Acidoferrum sp.]|nr:ATP-binding protein [Candidatus Acidoferrum sp.]